MKMRSLCEAPGGLSLADNGYFDYVDNDPDVPYAYEEIEGPLNVINPKTGKVSLIASPYDPYKTPLATGNDHPFYGGNTGLAPVNRNIAASKTETLKQTSGMWDYLGKVSYTMASLFPGAMGVYTGNKLADYVKTPEVNPGKKPTSKTGGTGIVIPPPEAVSPPLKDPDAPPDENPFAHSFDWWRSLMGLPSYESPPGTPPNAPLVTPSGTPPDEVPFWKDFWNKMNTPEADPNAPENFFAGVGDYVGGVFPKINSPAIPLIAVGIGIVLLILIIK